MSPGRSAGFTVGRALSVIASISAVSVVFWQCFLAGTLTESRAAVTQVQGAVVGAIALIGFAGVAAANIPALPLAVAQLAALAAWVACAIGGYLAQAALLSTAHEAVRELARQRRA